MNFRVKLSCLNQLLCFCCLKKNTDPVRLLTTVSSEMTVGNVPISSVFSLPEATQPWSYRWRQNRKGQSRDLNDGPDFLYLVGQEEQKAQALP